MAGVTKAKSLPMTSDRMQGLVRFLIDLSKKSHGTNFRALFPQLWPNSAAAYARIIANPIDLGTMIRKLKDRKYATFDAFKSDVDLLYANASQFNGPDHDLAQSARNLCNDIAKKLSEMTSDAFSQTADMKPGNAFVAVKSGSKLSTYFVHRFLHNLFAIINLAEQLGVDALVKDGMEVFRGIHKDCSIDLELYAPDVWLQTKEGSVLRWWFERRLSNMTFSKFGEGKSAYYISNTKLTAILAKGPKVLESGWLGDVPGMLDSAPANPGQDSIGGNQQE